MPERLHPNRTAYNGLIYAMIDAWLDARRALIRGDLYDLGCGEAPYRERFLGSATSYTGIDWKNSPHRLCADIVADLDQRLPVADESADTAILISVLEHLSEPQTLLDETFRILRPGGAVLLQVPFMWPVHEAPHDYFRFTEYGLRHVLGKSGFTAIEIETEGGFWTLAALRFNYRSVGLLRGPRLFRRLVELPLRAIWAIDQYLAPRLDAILPSPAETVGYLVCARKP